MGLTPKQEKFCQLIVEGKSQAEAYRQAFDVKKNTKPESVYEQASVLMNNLNITSRIQELRVEVTKEIKFTIQDALKEFEEAQENLRIQNNWVGFGKITTEKAKLLGLYENDGNNVNVNVSVMPDVKIDGESLDLDIGDDATDKSSEAS